jgi:hypothetical protein
MTRASDDGEYWSRVSKRPGNMQSNHNREIGISRFMNLFCQAIAG